MSMTSITFSDIEIPWTNYSVTLVSKLEIPKRVPLLEKSSQEKFNMACALKISNVLKVWRAGSL